MLQVIVIGDMRKRTTVQLLRLLSRKGIRGQAGQYHHPVILITGEFS